MLLRKSAVNLWGGCNEATHETVKNRLLAGIQVDIRKDLRKKLCDTTGVIGAPLVNAGNWPELIPALFELSRSPAPHHRESALYIFSQICDTLDTKLVEPNLEHLYQIFRSCLLDDNISVELAALKATCRLICVVATQLCAPFEGLILQMLQPVRRSLESGNEDEARAAIELFIEVTETEPRFFLPQLNNVFQLMFQVANAEDLEDNTRQMGMEFLLSMAEKTPSQCRKIPSFVSTLLPIGMKMMLDIDDDPTWYDADDTEDETKDYDMFHAGEEAMDRVAIALGGKTVLPVVESLLPAYFGNTESWQHRHAGIIAISQVGEGCQVQIRDKMSEFVHEVIKYFKDPHPRVRWAAINCIGQMCTDFGPEIQSEYHSVIAPSLIAVMEDSSVPRVQAHGAAALINYCDESVAPVVTPYLHDLLKRLQAMLQSNRRLLHEQAITGIAAVSDCAGKHFAEYYTEFMPSLITALRETAGHKEKRKLRGKIMECISLIGLSVGPEYFRRDVTQIMDILVKSSDSMMTEPDDPQFFYLMQAYARICRCLQKEFLPYVPHVVPKFLVAAAQKPEIEVKDALPDEEDTEEGYETIQIGDKRIGIRTSCLDDKATACTMIACFIHELKGGFYPYIQDVVNLMVPLMTFFYHDDVRVAAANCVGDFIPCILDAKVDGATAQIAQLVQFVVPKLIEAVQGEPEVDVLIALLEAFTSIGRHTKGGMLTPEMLVQCAGALFIIIQESCTRTKERWTIADEQEWDEEERQEVLAEEKKESDILAGASDIMGELVRHHGSHGFIDAVQKEFAKVHGQSLTLVALFATMLDPGKMPFERRTALCFFDDLISHGGEKGRSYIPQVLPYMRKYSVDEKADVAQSAIFGFGECAKVGGNLFEPAVGAEMLPIIEQRLASPEAFVDDNAAVTDNFISTLGKLLEFQPGLFTGQTGPRFGSLWLQHMPTSADIEEAEHINAALVRSVERGDMRVLGENYCNLSKIFSVFARVLAAQTISAEYAKRLVDIVKKVDAEVAPEIVQGAFASLTETDRVKLHQAVASGGIQSS